MDMYEEWRAPFFFIASGATRTGLVLGVAGLTAAFMGPDSLSTDFIRV